MRLPPLDSGSRRRFWKPSRALAVTSALVVLAWPSSSRASEGAEGPHHEASEERDASARHGGHLKEHTENLLGAKALALFLIVPAEPAEPVGPVEPAPEGEHTEDAGGHELHPRFGASVFYERELIQNRLEFEIQIALVGGGGMFIMPIDLLLKKPFHVNHRVTPYIGVGPALDAVFTDGEQEVLVGLTSAAGVYVWFSKYAGIDVEIDYTIVVSEHGIEHAPCFGVGPAFHF